MHRKQKIRFLQCTYCTYACSNYIAIAFVITAITMYMFDFITLSGKSVCTCPPPMALKLLTGNKTIHRN